MSTTLMLAGFGLGPQELLVLAIFGLLVFGKRLPEVGKSLGKSIVEFKKGLNGIEDEVNSPPPPAAPRQQDILPPPRPAGTENRTDVNQQQATPTGQAS